MTARPAPSPLRQLAIDYAIGRLERGDYLAARRHLLDALQANAASGTNAGIGTAPPSTGCDGGPIPNAPTAPAGASPTLLQSLPWPLLAAAVGALLLLGGVGYALLSSHPEPTPPSATGVAARLPRSATADPCTRSVIAQPDSGPSARCQDPFVAASTSHLELRVVPAATPFAITEQTHNLTEWCLRNDALCRGAADAGATGAAYSRWMSQQTGRSYRPATATELSEASAYDGHLGQVDQETIRLVRPLEVTGNDLEATRLDLWWRRFHRP